MRGAVRSARWDKTSGWCAAFVTAMIAACLLAACGTQNKDAMAPAGHGDAQSAGSSSGTGNTPSDAAPKIHISYAQANDFLASLSVTKYSGAEELAKSPVSGGTASVIRFAGGVIIWQIDVEKGIFGGLGPRSEYAIDQVKYGMVPPHFVQSVPEEGPPEPLEPGHFYVFSVIRKSASNNYQVVKVEPGGSFQGYVADPRAGTSFQLCCNIGADFTMVANPALDLGQPAP
jgi:hypothetical protein